MLRTITELVPFGHDNKAKNICGYYLANVTGAPREDSDYLVCFFETKSVFCPEGVFKVKYITGWNRINSNFNLTKEIFKEDGWVDEKDFRTDDSYLNLVISAMIRRAVDNGVYDDPKK